MTAVIERETDKAQTAANTAERRCLACGELKPRESLIRFVIGPDQSVVPDLAESLPGPGLWVSADRDSITLAARKNLFAKAAREPAKPAADLADLVATLLRKRCGEFLGLTKRAGIAVLGEAQTETALRSGKLAFFLRAPDATRVLDNRHHAIECALFSRDELGAAFGYDQIVYAGILPHGLTKKVEMEINRLSSMTATNQERKIV